MSATPRAAATALVLLLATAVCASPARAQSAPAPSPSPSASATPGAVELPTTVNAPPGGGAGIPVPQGSTTRGSGDHAGYSYSYAVDDRHYDDTTIATDTYKPFGDPASRFRPFVDLYAVDDSRTTPGESIGGGPPVPLIFSDNYALLAAGVQYTTPQGLRLYVQGGASATIGTVAAVPSGGDVRGGVQLYRQWGAQETPGATYGNFYGGTSYLSRYQDVISYNQLEIVHDLASAKDPLELYLRPVITLDTRVHYYSNLAEASLGLRWHPIGVHGPILSVEGVEGLYLRGTLPEETKRTYNDLRPTLSYGFNL